MVLNQWRQTLLFRTGSINPNNHQQQAPEPLAAVSDCHSRRSDRSSSISTWGSTNDIGSGSFLPPLLQESALIKISTPGPYFYYRFTQPVRGLSIKAQINVDGSWWQQRRFWVLADRIANGWQSRLILLTIRSNLFRAKSSLKVSGGPTPYQQGVAAAVTLPSGGPLHYYYTWLTDSDRCNTSDASSLRRAPDYWSISMFIAVSVSVPQETIGRLQYDLVSWPVLPSLSRFSQYSRLERKIIILAENTFATLRRHQKLLAIKNIYICILYIFLTKDFFNSNVLWQLMLLSLSPQYGY